MGTYERTERDHRRAFKKLFSALAKRVHAMPADELRIAVEDFLTKADTNVVCAFAQCAGIDLEKI